MVIQSVGHFLYCALRTDKFFLFWNYVQRTDLFLYSVLRSDQKFYLRTTDGGPFLILHFEVRLQVVVIIIKHTAEMIGMYHFSQKVKGVGAGATKPILILILFEK